MRAELVDELTGRDLVRKVRQRNHQRPCLAPDARPEKDQNAGKEGQEHRVGDDDGAQAVAQPPVEPRDERLEKISEQDGEEEERQRAAGGVQEVKNDEEDQRREKDAKGAGVPEFVEHWLLSCFPGSLRNGSYTDIIVQYTEGGMSSFVAMQDAQEHLAELLERVDGGEDIVIERDGRAAVKLVAVVEATPVPSRVFGQKVMGDISFLPGWEDDLPLDMFDALKDEDSASIG